MKRSRIITIAALALVTVIVTSFLAYKAQKQIGYNTRIIGIKRSYGDYQIMVNPEIVERKWTALSLSTCLSLKGLHILPRDFWVKVHYRDLSGATHEEILRFASATLMQQEIDHLNGILVSDYLL